jgi:hypothetical protein
VRQSRVEGRVFPYRNSGPRGANHGGADPIRCPGMERRKDRRENRQERREIPRIHEDGERPEQSPATGCAA